MSNVDTLRKQIAKLESRADSLEKRYNKLIGKSETYAPRSQATMREGVPLEVFSRLSLIDADFEVFGIYAFDYWERSSGIIERSVDIYASRDSRYTVPEDDNGPMAGQSWDERDHLLVEVKQRREGVEWIFSALPRSKKEYSIAGEEIPIANTGFELRPNESGANSKGSPKDVNNAIAQLNQSYMPFEVGLATKDSIRRHGMSRQYVSLNNRDQIWLLLITNARLIYFDPPELFSEIKEGSPLDAECFREVPWIVFQPEASTSLEYHQGAVIANNHLCAGLTEDKIRSLHSLAELTHEVHIVNYDNLDRFLSLVNDPPRLKSIQFNLSVGGKKSSFEVGSSNSKKDDENTEN